MAVIVASRAGVAASPELWPSTAPFADPDYADAFTVSTTRASSCSPEQWARHILEGASLPMRLFLLVGWRCALGFRLARRDAVLGWPVVAEAADWVVLQQQSWLFGVALLMRVRDDELSWATRVSYTSPVAGAAWSVIGVLHRRFAPRALHRAAAHALL